VLESIRRTQLCFKGPMTTPVSRLPLGQRRPAQGARSYAAVRPVKSYPGTPSRYGHVDMVVIRENTKSSTRGSSSIQGREHGEAGQFVEKELGMDLREDVGVSIKLISRFGTERVVRFAFEYARKNGRRKVTAVHKANIMKASDGLFLAVARRGGLPEISSTT
jgi:isocitrate dehydrogenase (NAD+)